MKASNKKRIIELVQEINEMSEFQRGLGFYCKKHFIAFINHQQHDCLESSKACSYCRIDELEAKLDDIADKVELAADILDTVPLCDGCMQEDSDPCGCWISELKAMLNKEQGDE